METAYSARLVSGLFEGGPLQSRRLCRPAISTSQPSSTEGADHLELRALDDRAEHVGVCSSRQHEGEPDTFLWRPASGDTYGQQAGPSCTATTGALSDRARFGFSLSEKASESRHRYT